MVTTTPEARPAITADQIVDMVERRVRQTELRRVRMDEDWNRASLVPYNTNTLDAGVDTGADFRSFTTNEPRTFMLKIWSILSNAELLIQLPYGQAREAQQDLYDGKELFMQGLLDMANERLTDKVEMEVQDALSALVPARGWGGGLFLMRNDEQGRSFPHIEPWDMRNVYWQVGADGLEWACLKTTRLVSDVAAEYPASGLSLHLGDEDTTEVYNFWNKTHNWVIAGEGERASLTHTQSLKPPTKHGWVKCPVVIVPVGPAPRVFSGDVKRTEALYGESIFSANRGIYDWFNEAMSIYLELVTKARDQTYLWQTDDDDQDMEDDPNKRSGLVVTSREDKFGPIPLAEMTKDAQLFMAQIAGMVQRGALPYSAFGELQFAISGFAITQLNQQLITVLQPEVKAIALIMGKGLNMLVDQFVSGAFNPLTLQGGGFNREFTHRAFQPQELMNLPLPKIQLSAQLPEDDESKMRVAQGMVSDTGLLGPIGSMEHVRERVLKVPNAGLMAKQIRAEQAAVGSPTALSYTLARASWEQENQELAGLHMSDLHFAEAQKTLALIQLQAQAEGAGVNPAAHVPNPTTGDTPQAPIQFIQIGEAQRAQGLTPNPQAGPNQPPGARRNRPGVLGQLGQAVSRLVGRGGGGNGP